MFGWACGLSAIGTGADESLTDASAANASEANDGTGGSVLPSDASDATDAALDADGATADAAQSDAADAGTFCTTVAPPPTFCADFDEDTDPSVGWSYTVAEGGASVTTSTAHASSKPRALHDAWSGGVGSVGTQFAMVDHMRVRT